MGTLLHSTAHGLTTDDPIYLANLIGGAGLEEETLYYVLAAGLTADDFAISLSEGGAAVVFTTDVTSGSVVRPTTYEPNDDAVMFPPVPPVVPIISGVSSTVEQSSAGTPVGALVVTIADTHIPSLRVTYIEVTSTLLADGVTPDFSNAMRLPISAGQTSVVIPGVAAGQNYWVRSFAEDIYANQTAYAEYVPVTIVKDTEAPPAPVGLTVTPAVKALFVSWDTGVAPAQDLAFYEIRYAKDDGTGLAADNVWTIVRSKTDAVYIGGLIADSVPTDGVADQLYWVQVRAIDTTGNVLDSGVAKDYTAYPDAGWCAAVSATPALVDGDLIAFNSITTDHVLALDAGKIQTGYLRINTADGAMADGIRVYDGDTLVGMWDETGLYAYSNDDPADYVRVYNGGITVFLDGIEVSALDSSGVNADAISFGTVPGGGNAILNSSFELADFSTPTSVTFDDTASADFTASQVGSDVNVTTGATALTVSGLTY